MRTRFRTRVAVGALVAGLGCSGSTVIGPSNQLQVANVTDNFQFQVSTLSKVTQTLSYTWTNTGTTATVNNSSAVTGGTATLTILSGTTQVYTGLLTASGTANTTAGVAGNWTIQVKLDKVDGTLNFRVQKI